MNMQKGVLCAIEIFERLLRILEFPNSENNTATLLFPKKMMKQGSICCATQGSCLSFSPWAGFFCREEKTRTRRVNGVPSVLDDKKMQKNMR